MKLKQPEAGWAAGNCAAPRQPLHSQLYLDAIQGPLTECRGTWAGLWFAMRTLEQRRQVVVGGARRCRKLNPSLQDKASRIGKLSPLKLTFPQSLRLSTPNSVFTTWMRSDLWLFNRSGRFFRNQMYSPRMSSGDACNNIFESISLAEAAWNWKKKFSHWSCLWCTLRRRLAGASICWLSPLLFHFQNLLKKVIPFSFGRHPSKSQAGNKLIIIVKCLHLTKKTFTFI